MSTNGYTKIRDEKQFRSGNVPKVVFRKDGRLLYMSRSPIPVTKKQKFITHSIMVGNTLQIQNHLELRVIGILGKNWVFVQIGL